MVAHLGAKQMVRGLYSTASFTPEDGETYTAYISSYDNQDFTSSPQQHGYGLVLDQSSAGGIGFVDLVESKHPS